MPFFLPAQHNAPQGPYQPPHDAPTEAPGASTVNSGPCVAEVGGVTPVLQAITVPARRVVSLDQEFCLWVPECQAEQLDLRVSAYLHAGVVWASRDLVAEWAAGGVTIAAPPPFKSLPDMWHRAANRRFQFVAACALTPDSAAKRRPAAPTSPAVVVAAHLGVSLTWQSPASLMSE